MEYALIKDIIAPLGAAFAGAYFAYLWQNKHQRKERKERELSQCTNVYITLYNQLELIVKTANFFIDNIDKEIRIQELEIGQIYNVNEASIPYIAINDINTFILIRESNTASNLFTSILKRYNSEVKIENDLLALHYMSTLINMTNEIYEHFISTQIALKKYIKQNYKTDNYIDLEIKDGVIDFDKINHLGKILNKKCQHLAQQHGILLKPM